jgi:hypothetical protein
MRGAFLQGLMRMFSMETALARKDIDQLHFDAVSPNFADYSIFLHKQTNQHWTTYIFTIT